MKNFSGLRVRWQLHLRSVSQTETPGECSLQLKSLDGDQSIFCKVGVSKYPRLKVARQGDSMEVRGTIDDVSLGGHVIMMNVDRIIFSGSEPVDRPGTTAIDTGVDKRPPVDDTSNEFGEISFDCLPASLLSNGWKAADAAISASIECSVPPGVPGGVTRQAKSEDAIDYAVQKYQRVCNRLRFAAKLADDAHVYAKIQVASKGGHGVPKFVWIACDSGDKPPQKRPGDEWVIFRVPQKDGWLRIFDLFLPDEVKVHFPSNRRPFNLASSWLFVFADRYLFPQ